MGLGIQAVSNCQWSECCNEKIVIAGAVWSDCNKEHRLGKPVEAAAFQRFGAWNEYIYRHDREEGPQEWRFLIPLAEEQESGVQR